MPLFLIKIKFLTFTYIYAKLILGDNNMKILKELNYDDLKDKSRDEIIEMLEEELKYVSTTEIIGMVCRLRKAKVEEQKFEVQTQMQTTVDKLSKHQEILKDKDANIKDKQKAYGKIMQFLSKNKVVLDKGMLNTTRDMLEFLSSQKDELEIEDIQDFDFLMQKRVKILSDLPDYESRRVANINNSKYVDIMLELDAKFGLDGISQEHIDNAVNVKYGDLVRRESPQSARFYYYSRSAYEEMYSMFKKKYEDIAEATQEV